MDAQKCKLKEQESLNLGSSITSIASCSEYFAVGCLDDSLRVWRSNLAPFAREPVILHQDSVSCITDVGFMRNSTHVASISMDATLRVWDIDTNATTIIETPTLAAWRLVFAGDSIITCGDLGRVAYYDLFSREVIKKMEVGDSHLSALTVSASQRTLALGNINGDAFVFNIEDRDKTVTFKPHFKTIRSVQLSQASDKLISCSDDGTVAVTDVPTGKKQLGLEGHGQRVNAVRVDDRSPHILYSCSSDKSARVWDMRVRDSVECYQSGGPLVAIERVGRHLVTGGDLGTLHILKVE